MVVNKIDIPFVEHITEEERLNLEFLWNKYCGPYIVDPVSDDQALWIMYNELPKKCKKGFKIQFINNANDAFKIEMERS